MKAQSGFTMVELMIVIAITGIVLALGALNYRPIRMKHTTESYIRQIHATLMQARAAAANTNTPRIVTVAANSVSVTQDLDGNGAINGAEGATTVTTNFPRLVIGSSLGVPQTLTFDRRGLTTNAQTITLTGYGAGVSPAMDCVVVAFSRINMGRTIGGACVQQ